MTNKFEQAKANKLELELISSSTWIACHDEIYLEGDGTFVCTCPNPMVAAYVAELQNNRVLPRPLEC